ncbi:unnamed protein product [Phaedon cochleariae]|uniref:Helitron helicase-like domain-containing protein n=1 Tax=Phaedon cochleariae TaxID=80249 RepID=A0A9P0DT15_PHACE|nr:unnamed protein product [Phaedon cochleariae]
MQKKLSRKIPTSIEMLSTRMLLDYVNLISGWPEIKNNHKLHQKWANRPDLVCRVFHTNLLEFIDDITAKQYFGVPLNYMYTGEFQMRGLPHAHDHLTLGPEPASMLLCTPNFQMQMRSPVCMTSYHIT